MTPYNWFFERVLPPLFTALTIGVITSGIATYNSVQSLTSKINETDRQVAELKVRVEEVSTRSVNRVELLETMKRVELQLELMMVKAKVGPGVKLEKNE